MELTPGKVDVTTSTQNGSRYLKTVREFDTVATSSNIIYINKNKTYQKINGFGGALTDTTGININSLPKAAGDHLMR